MLTELLAGASIILIGGMAGFHIGHNLGWRNCTDYALELDRCTECSGSMRGPFHEADCSMMPVRLAPQRPGAAAMVPYGPDHPNYPNTPGDWDGGRVRTRGGAVYLHEEYEGRWQHHGSGMDIMAYTPYPAEHMIAGVAPNTGRRT